MKQRNLRNNKALKRLQQPDNKNLNCCLSKRCNYENIWQHFNSNVGHFFKIIYVYIQTYLCIFYIHILYIYIYYILYIYSRFKYRALNSITVLAIAYLININFVGNLPL